MLVVLLTKIPNKFPFRYYWTGIDSL